MEMDIGVKYLNMKMAAKYCGYNAQHFSKLVQKYAIPRYGPSRNKFKTDDLDNFMKHPTYYTDKIRNNMRRYAEVRV